MSINYLSVSHVYCLFSMRFYSHLNDHSFYAKAVKSRMFLIRCSLPRRRIGLYFLHDYESVCVQIYIQLVSFKPWPSSFQETLSHLILRATVVQRFDNAAQRGEGPLQVMQGFACRPLSLSLEPSPQLPPTLSTLCSFCEFLKSMVTQAGCEMLLV